MTIDPSTLPDGTVVEVRGKGSDADLTTAYVFAGVAYPFVTPNGEPRTPFDVPRDAIVRTFSPDPLPSQEVPRDEWANIKPGSRVHLSTRYGLDATGAVTQTKRDANGLWVGARWFGFDSIVHLFVLDEPADPDADLIERAAQAVLDNFHGPDDKHATWHLNPETVARAVLAVVREAGA